MKTITIEYEEQYVKKGEPLRVVAQDAANIRILDVTPVGDELRYQFVAFRDNGDA